MSAPTTGKEVNLAGIPTFSYIELTEVLADLLANTDPRETFDVVALMGPHGMGKSCWAKDIGRVLQVPTVVETMSGKEPTDIIGLQYYDEDKKAATLAPPGWFNRDSDANSPDDIYPKEWVKQLEKIMSRVPADRMPERVLVLDEYNRVPPDTFGPMMNIVLTNEHHGVKMNKRTLIILTGNLNKQGTDDYNVNKLDPAQQDRIREVEVKTNLDEWFQVVSGELHDGVLNYAKENHKSINAFHKKGILSLRTLTRLGRRFKDMDDSVIQARGTSIIGMFVPRGLVHNIYQCITAISHDIPLDKVMLDYSKVQPRVKKMVKAKNVAHLNTLVDKLCDGMIEWQKKNQPSVTAMDSVVDNVLAFLEDANKPATFKAIRVFINRVQDNPLILMTMKKMSRANYFRSLVRQVTQEGNQS